VRRGLSFWRMLGRQQERVKLDGGPLRLTTRPLNAQVTNEGAFYIISRKTRSRAVAAADDCSRTTGDAAGRLDSK
jgi:hypothetical protein